MTDTKRPVASRTAVASSVIARRRRKRWLMTVRLTS